MDKGCQCIMFQQKGTCFHTGYKPLFHTPIVRVPRAVERMARHLEEHRERYAREDAARDNRR